MEVAVVVPCGCCAAAAAGVAAAVVALLLGTGPMFSFSSPNSFHSSICSRSCCQEKKQTLLARFLSFCRSFSFSCVELVDVEYVETGRFVFLERRTYTYHVALFD